MFSFENTYVQLPEAFYQKIHPTSASKPELIHFNLNLAKFLNLQHENTSAADITKWLSGKSAPLGSEPLAMAYAGHQFAHFTMLGDGRAILMGEVRAKNKQLYDLQWKGSGPTQYSRRGDGLSSVGPVIREYLLSEAMHALGVPSTRALGACLSGEDVWREFKTPGAVIVRVARSHIRVGTFEYFAAKHDVENLKILADYSIARLYPDSVSSKNKYLDFFKAVGERQIQLVAKWMSLGFIHGVMNTDNTAISGESIDFGPCAFMDQFNANKVYSSIDRGGRYAYNQQMNIVLWNLNCLANCLVPLASTEELEALLKDLVKYSHVVLLQSLGQKFGIFQAKESDRKLIDEYMLQLQNDKHDFTNSFRDLSSEMQAKSPWHQNWLQRLESQEQSIDQAKQLMDSVNPYVIPRNHQVEKAIQAANQKDFSLFKKLFDVLQSPYEENKNASEYTQPPSPEEEVQKTFCGT